jgi:prepilin peptidase CpaA
MRELLPLIVAAPLPLLLAWAMVSDLMRLEIPNAIPIIVVIAFVVAAMVMGFEVVTILRQLAIGIGALVVGLGLFAARVVGGGDVKLLAGLLPWLAPDQLPAFFIWMALVGGLLAVVALLLRNRRLGPAWRRSRWFEELSKGQTKIPYGLAIGCAGLIALPGLPIFGN